MLIFNRLIEFVIGLILFSLVSCGPTDPTAGDTEPGSPTSPLAPITPTPLQPTQISLKRYEKCDNIKNIFDNKEKQITPSSALKRKFQLKKEFGGSASGAKIFLVGQANSPSESRVVLKTLPSSFVTQLTDQDFREAYFSCMVSKVNSNHYLKGDLKANIFFPGFYDVGFTDSREPLAAHPILESEPIPFIIIEYIEGLSLGEFFEDRQKATNTYGYNIDTAPANFIKSVMLQLLVALINADLSLKKFTHQDLHPENIKLSKKSPGLSFVFGNKEFASTSPLIKILDFGLSYNDKFSLPGRKFIHKVLKEPEKALLEIERPDLGAIATGSLGAWLYLNFLSDPDIRSINFYLQAFLPRLKKLGISVEKCDNFVECLKQVIAWP